MIWILVALLLMSLLALAGLGWHTWQVKLQLADLRQQLAASADAAMEDGKSVAGASQAGHPVILVEVRNPLELASQHHRLGTAMSMLSPKFTQRIVFSKVVEIMQQQLEEQGVDAHVSLLNR